MPGEAYTSCPRQAGSAIARRAGGKAAVGLEVTLRDPLAVSNTE